MSRNGLVYIANINLLNDTKANFNRKRKVFLANSVGTAG